MADSRRILWIDKTGSQAAHERIAPVSGMGADAVGWSTQAEAVTAANAGTWRFDANVWGRAVWIVVASNAEWRKFLRTETDGSQPDNLHTSPSRGKAPGVGLPSGAGPTPVLTGHARRWKPIDKSVPDFILRYDRGAVYSGRTGWVCGDRTGRADRPG